MTTPCKVSFEVGPEGASKAGSRNDICIIVDVLRASSTMITALYTGMNSVTAVEKLSDCIAQSSNEVTAGEIKGEKIPGLNYGNSPLELLNSFSINPLDIHSPQPPNNKSLLLITTNGTKCIQSSKGASQLLIGGFLNKKAVANCACSLSKQHKQDISIILAGFHGKLEEDDLIAGSSIFFEIPNASLVGEIQPIDLPLPLALKEKETTALQQFMENSPAGKRLININQQDDIAFCSKQDLISIVPIYDKQQKTFIKYEP